MSGGCGGAGGGDKRPEFGGVFLAGREFDAGDNVDAAGIEEAEGVGDVVGGEASSDDDGADLFYALGEREDGAPVEGPARASASSGRAGVEEDAVVGVADGEVGVELRWIGEQFASLERLDDFAETERRAKFGKLGGWLVAVELNAGEAEVGGKFGKALRSFVDNHSDLLDGGR